MNTRAPIPSFVLVINNANPFGDLAIFLLPCRGRTLAPGVEAANRDPQDPAHDADLPLPQGGLDKAETVFYGCEKMATAFFKISRSWRNISFSRRNRRTSASSGC